MNEQMFDIYRKASESWFKLQQELFDGLYKSTMLFFQQTSQAPAAAKPSENSKATKATPQPGAAKSRHSRKAAGRRPGRPGARNR